MTARNDGSIGLPPGKSPGRRPSREELVPGADLREADLTYIELIEADLRESDLTGAKVLGADLTDAKLDGVIFPVARPTDLDF